MRACARLAHLFEHQAPLLDDLESLDLCRGHVLTVVVPRDNNVIRFLKSSEPKRLRFASLMSFMMGEEALTFRSVNGDEQHQRNQP